MTKKQFEWLRNHQPIEVSYVGVYEEHKKNYPYYCNINEVDFKGDNIVVKGVAHKYINKYSTGSFTKVICKEVYVKYEVPYKYVRWINYRRKQLG